MRRHVIYYQDRYQMAYKRPGQGSNAGDMNHHICNFTVTVDLQPVKMHIIIVKCKISRLYLSSTIFKYKIGLTPK